MKTKSERQREASARQEAYSQLSVKAKLDKLDEQLGKGVGAVRQRARLSKQLDKEGKR
jgi:hypothetical protein